MKFSFIALERAISFAGEAHVTELSAAAGCAITKEGDVVALRKGEARAVVPWTRVIYGEPLPELDEPKPPKGKRGTA
ncbi:hypothetical protein [Pendulispora albinea]|uniref:Uncharacterized protein n=1 Tax=Pendulispora albinea TaxID=2741071 RepID=A0ABZ2LWW0_9BACT